MQLGHNQIILPSRTRFANKTCYTESGISRSSSRKESAHPEHIWVKTYIPYVFVDRTTKHKTSPSSYSWIVQHYSTGPSGFIGEMRSCLVFSKQISGFLHRCSLCCCSCLHTWAPVDERGAGASFQLVQTCRQTGLPRRRAQTPKQWLRLCNHSTHCSRLR